MRSAESSQYRLPATSEGRDRYDLVGAAKISIISWTVSNMSSALLSILPSARAWKAPLICDSFLSIGAPVMNYHDEEQCTNSAALRSVSCWRSAR